MWRHAEKILKICTFGLLNMPVSITSKHQNESKNWNYAVNMRFSHAKFGHRNLYLVQAGACHQELRDETFKKWHQKFKNREFQQILLPTWKVSTFWRTYLKDHKIFYNFYLNAFSSLLSHLEAIVKNLLRWYISKKAPVWIFVIEIACRNKKVVQNMKKSLF